MKKPTKATAGTRHAKAIAHDLRFGPGDYQSRIDRASRRIDAAIRRAVKAERERCRKIVATRREDMNTGLQAEVLLDECAREISTNP